MNPDDTDPQGGDPLAAQIARVAGNKPPPVPQTDPLADQIARVAAIGDPSAVWHDAFKSGALQKIVAARNAADQEAARGPLAEIGQGLRQYVGGLPFGVGKPVLAFGRSVDEGVPYQQALAETNADRVAFAQAHSLAAPALTAAANLTAFRGLPATIGGLGLRGTGALVGGGIAAAERATQSDASLKDKLMGTLEAGAIGSGAGAVMPGLVSSTPGRALLGAGLGAAGGAMAAPQGHAWGGAGIGAVAGGAAGAYAPELAAAGSKLPGRIGAALGQIAQASGVRGAVNREAAGIQSLLPPGGLVGDQGPMARQVVAEANAFKAASDRMYTVARTDTKVLNDPEIKALLADPDVQGAFRATAGVRSASGNPLPQAVVAQREVASPILQAGGTPFTTAENVTADVPDPEALHLTKRILADVVDRGFARDNPLPVEDALRVQPKVQRLAALLHDRSPDFKAADNFFQLGQTAGDMATGGYKAATPGMRNPSPGNVGINDVAGVRDAIARLSSVDPAQGARLQAVAAAAAQRGAQGEIAQQIAAKGLSGGRAGALSAPALDISGPAREQRALAFGAQAPEYENTLARVRSAAAADQPRRLFLPTRLEQFFAQTLGIGQNPLERGAAPGLLSQITQDPQAYQGVLRQFGKGTSLLDYLRTQIAANAGAAVGTLAP